jgi:methylenetetrahydrofolate dehydrogenase (NADP+)/methenyltetrahydrofolate cyclohydrolase
MTQILAGKPVATQIRAEVAARAAAVGERLGRPPGLAALLVGDDPASRIYVGTKAKACAEVGIAGRTVTLPATATQEELEAAVEALNRDPEIDGFLVQLPLPGHLDTRRVLERVAPAKDVDGFHPVNVGRLWSGEPGGFVPATPAGILELLRRSGIALPGLRAVVVGRSNIVGKPMAALLLAEHCTVTLCHSRTRDLAAVCREADLLVAALGRPGFLGREHVRAGAVVIDVGVNRVDDPEQVARLFPGDEGRRAQLAEKGYVLCGDVDQVAVLGQAGALTPVPGGVGPLTVTMLLVNVLQAAERAGWPA